MARLIDRVTNVWRNDLERDPHRDSGNERDIREDQTRRIAEEMRDNLLGQALVVKHEWQTQLTNSVSVRQEYEIDDYHRGKLTGLNEALNELTGIEPSITATIPLQQIETLVHEQVSEIHSRRDLAYEEEMRAAQPSLDFSLENLDNLALPGVATTREWQTHKEWDAEMDAEAARDNSMGMSL